MNDDRFLGRTRDYSDYRPEYPKELFHYLVDELGLKASDAVADIGSGTGKFTRHLVEIVNVVYGVEPNDEMRMEAEKRLGTHSHFKSVAGKAEATGLPPRSIDVVTVAQAFHWFDSDTAKTEFQRILKPKGTVILIWYDRTVSTPFEKAYEVLVTNFGMDYGKVNLHGYLRSRSPESFFAPTLARTFELAVTHWLDLHGMLGRLRSSSFLRTDHGGLDQKLETAANSLFRRYAKKGVVQYGYNLFVYSGELGD